MEHNHECCKHELAHCDGCETVYCKKCGKRWGEKEYVYIPAYVLPVQLTPYPSYTYPTIWCGTGMGNRTSGVATC